MSELYDQIVSQRGSMQRLLARIPGFRGYQDKAERRNADMMLRDHIAGELAKRVKRTGFVGGWRPVSATCAR